MGMQVAHTLSVLPARSFFASRMTEDSIWTILGVITVSLLCRKLYRHRSNMAPRFASKIVVDFLK